MRIIADGIGIAQFFRHRLDRLYEPAHKLPHAFLHGILHSQIDAFGKALAAYRLDVGNFPTTAQGLTALVVRPEGAGKWHGPYMEKAVPPDPWGRVYQYKSPGDVGRDYEIVSLGRDGQPGGEAEDADLHSWD